MEIFAKRLKELRLGAGMNQSKLAEALGISRQSVTQYENEVRTPDIKVLVKMAGYFGVTSDYLVGLSDIPDRTTKLPDELARITEEQKETLRHCDDVIIISKLELMEIIGKAIFG